MKTSSELTHLDEIYKIARSTIVHKIDYWTDSDGSSLESVVNACHHLAENGYGKSYYLLHMLYDAKKSNDAWILSMHFEKLALEWCLANQDTVDVEVWNDLGEIYQNLEVDNNFRLAAYWFRRAADKGYDLAQYNLSQCHHFGLGVPKNLHEAIKLCSLAADQGNTIAIANLKHMHREIGSIEGNLPDPDVLSSVVIDSIKRMEYRCVHCESMNISYSNPEIVDGDDWIGVKCIECGSVVKLNTTHIVASARNINRTARK